MWPGLLWSASWILAGSEGAVIPSLFGFLMAEWRMASHMRLHQISSSTVAVMMLLDDFRRPHERLDPYKGEKVHRLACRCGVTFYGRPSGSWRAVRVR